MQPANRSTLVFILTLISLVVAHPVRGNDTIDIGGLSVPPGSSVAGMIPVPDTGDGVSTSIPVTVFNGAQDGPVVTLVAGIHGAEYSPILAMQRVVRQLDSATMAGAVIVVHNANLPAFQQRTVYVGPYDLKNLNRAFPGDADGSITERIAHVLTEEVIKQTDYLIDIHSGDANEGLQPRYTAYYAEAGSPEVIEKSRRMTVAFGLDTIVLFGGDLSTPQSRIYTSAQAVSLGIPSMDVESGELGLIDDFYITPIVNGVISVMRDLDMIPGEATPTESPLWIAERARVYSEFDGVWHADDSAQAGNYVHEGARLGVITDYHGNDLAEITAPASGILLILFGTPPVNEGDNIAVIGLVNRE
jgi:predicted deacylase